MAVQRKVGDLSSPELDDLRRDAYINLHLLAIGSTQEFEADFTSTGLHSANSLSCGCSPSRRIDEGYP